MCQFALYCDASDGPRALTSLLKSCAQLIVAAATISAGGMPASARNRNSSDWNLCMHKHDCVTEPHGTTRAY